MKREEILRMIVDLFLPNRCPLCGKVIHWSIDYCEECYKALPETGREICRGCGNDKCSCDRNHFAFIRCYPAFYYEGTARSAVINLKHNKNMIFPQIAAEKIVRDMENDIYIFKVDCIVPVPMTKSKLRKRGFNQAELIAQALSALLDAPVENDVIFKKRSFSEQHTLSSSSRRRNAEKIYLKTDSQAVKGKKVLLCDDVTTTGSTLQKCTEVLLEMGAEAVITAAAATTKK